MDFLTYFGIFVIIMIILIIAIVVIIPLLTPPAAQVITDPGYPNANGGANKRGWYNVQNLSSPRDYCGYVGSGVQPSNWSCALAGKKGWTSQNPANAVFLAGPTGGSNQSGPI